MKNSNHWLDQKHPDPDQMQRPSGAGVLHASCQKIRLDKECPDSPDRTDENPADGASLFYHEGHKDFTKFTKVCRVAIFAEYEKCTDQRPVGADMFAG